jgi:mannose-1-phosphate guanylyltransferase
MDDLVKKVMAKKKPIQSFISKKGFMDIGDKSSYKKAYQQYLNKLGKI